VIASGTGGAALTVNLPVADHGVLALVDSPVCGLSEDRPCCDSTRQNLGPGVSGGITANGSVFWL
jgi:hypothetical protein